jgi:inorganic pyrophosphatase
MIKVLIQVEAGSCERNLYDEKTLEFKGRRQMSRPFPYPYGFIIGTSAADGDCVDCYIITTHKLKAGSVVACEPVGLLEQDEDGEIDHKVLAALPGQTVELDERLLKELRDFIYALMAPFPDMHISIGNILPHEAALHHIQEFRDRQ